MCRRTKTVTNGNGLRWSSLGREILRSLQEKSWTPSERCNNADFRISRKQGSFQEIYTAWTEEAHRDCLRRAIDRPCSPDKPLLHEAPEIVLSVYFVPIF